MYGGWGMNDVKGVEGAVESLAWGCNDFGGTLYEEAITRSSGGKHGERLEPERIEGAIRGAGYVPFERSTLYGQVKKVFPLVNKSCQPLVEEHLIHRIATINPN